MSQLLQSTFGFVLIVFLVILVFWTVQVIFGPKEEKKTERKKNNRVLDPIGEQTPEDLRKALISAEEPKDTENAKSGITRSKSRNYWYNTNEVAHCPKGTKVTELYHYFNSPEEGTKELLMEMYDCGIVRTDLLEKIAMTQMEIAVQALEQGGDSFVLDDTLDEQSFELDEEFEEEVPEEFREEKENLKPLEDYEMVILAAIFEQWCVFVDNLETEVTLIAEPDMIQEIKQRLIAYGHSDFEDLLQGPQ